MGAGRSGSWSDEVKHPPIRLGAGPVLTPTQRPGLRAALERIAQQALQAWQRRCAATA